jgi:integrase
LKIGKHKKRCVTPPTKPATDANGAALILAALAGTPLELPFRVAFTCGLRPGELLALQRGDVDLTRRCIRIARALIARGSNAAYKPPKTESSKREVFVGENLARALEAHMATQQKKLGEYGINTTERIPLFDDGLGSIWKPDTFRRLYKRTLSRTDVLAIPWRGTRHTFSSIARTNRATLSDLKLILGHDSEATTERYYAVDNVNAEALRGIQDAVDHAISAGARTRCKSPS